MIVVLNQYNSYYNNLYHPYIDDFCDDFYNFDSDLVDKMDYYSSFVLNYEHIYHKSCIYGHGLLFSSLGHF